HAGAVTNMIVPALEGLAPRFANGATFLDIGVGVAGTAIAMAQQTPNLRVVGIDVWQPSLALARANVERAKLKDRIELREQPAESLSDEAAFDLAWMPVPFMPERIIPQAIERVLRALRPGGWLIIPFPAVDDLPPAIAAMFKIRFTQFGGPPLGQADYEQ